MKSEETMRTISALLTVITGRYQKMWFFAVFGGITSWGIPTNSVLRTVVLWWTSFISENPNGIPSSSPGLRPLGATLGHTRHSQQPQRGCVDSDTTGLAMRSTF